MAEAAPAPHPQPARANVIVAKKAPVPGPSVDCKAVPLHHEGEIGRYDPRDQAQTGVVDVVEEIVEHTIDPRPDDLDSGQPPWERRIAEPIKTIGLDRGNRSYHRGGRALDMARTGFEAANAEARH